MNKAKLTKVDIGLERYNGELILIDLKTAKPNISNFKDFKRTLDSDLFIRTSNCGCSLLYCYSLQSL
jgi:hypothetical protein